MHMKTAVQMRVSVVDDMVEVQCLDKPMADHLTYHIFQKFVENEELRLVWIDTTSYFL